MKPEKDHILESLIADGRKTDAMHLICEMVGEASRQRDFVRAETLRRKMLQVDEMAIALIVEAGECIEQEKNKAIDGRHRENWKDLYSRFTPGERSAFFFACDSILFSSGYFLFRQGEKNQNLFFVDDGCLQLLFLSGGGHEKILSRVGPGEFAGEDTFFGISTCTESLVGLTQGFCRRLSLEALGCLEKDFPGFITKIQAYCISAGTTGHKLSAKGVERRVYMRIPQNGIVVFQLLCREGSGKTNVLLKGLKADISAGGLSFYVSTSNDRAVRSLLGREIGMKFMLQLEDDSRSVVCRGKVVGILPCQNQEYSVHVKFGHLLKPLLAVL